MSICFKKLESTMDDSMLHTPLYGDIEKSTNINTDEYTWFDSYEDYELFVNKDGHSLAVKTESENINIIEQDIDYIKNNYDIETIKYDSITPAIIIKVNETKTSIINDIAKDFESNDNYNVKIITPQVLFLEPTNVDIQLEDTNAIDKLSDQDMKNVITKAGIKLSGSENKERLKGIM